MAWRFQTRDKQDAAIEDKSGFHFLAFPSAYGNVQNLEIKKGATASRTNWRVAMSKHRLNSSRDLQEKQEKGAELDIALRFAQANSHCKLLVRTESLPNPLCEAID